MTTGKAGVPATGLHPLLRKLRMMNRVVVAPRRDTASLGDRMSDRRVDGTLFAEFVPLSLAVVVLLCCELIVLAL